MPNEQFKDKNLYIIGDWNWLRSVETMIAAV
jgi:hypothetical protein